MKRSEALRSLSREHHGALSVARKLREAPSLESASEVFLTFWHEDGQCHFRIEEEVLLPQWAMYGEINRVRVSRMLEEHLAIRREALRLDANALTLAEVRALGDLLHDHVRFEERQLFPVIEEALGDTGLEEWQLLSERRSHDLDSGR